MTNLIAALVITVSAIPLCGCTVVSQQRAFPKLAWAWSHDARLEREYRKSEDARIENTRRKAELSDTLKQRDTKTLDLVVVGKDLVAKYGKYTAEKLVLETWSDLTNGAAQEKAKDVIWLQDQGHRVQDVAWMVAYREEWL